MRGGYSTSVTDDQADEQHYGETRRLKSHEETSCQGFSKPEPSAHTLKNLRTCWLPGSLWLHYARSLSGR